MLSPPNFKVCFSAEGGQLNPPLRPPRQLHIEALFAASRQPRRNHPRSGRRHGFTLAADGRGSLQGESGRVGRGATWWAARATVFPNTFAGLQVIKSGRWWRRSGGLFYSGMKSRPKEGDKEFNNPASRCFTVYLLHSEGLRNTRGVVALAAASLSLPLSHSRRPQFQLSRGGSRELEPDWLLLTAVVIGSFIN